MSDLCTITIPRETLAEIAGLLDYAEEAADPDGVDDDEAAVLWRVIGALAEPLGLTFVDGKWEALPAPSENGVTHDRGLSWPTVETVNLMLGQLKRDRATAYWGQPPHAESLDGAEAWLLSLRDWLESTPAEEQA